MSTHAPGLLPASVAIPGSEAELGCGDALRSRFVPGSAFAGAHTDNAAHFLRHVPGVHGWRGGELELRNVCWLAVGATLQAVPAGEWEAVLHVLVSARSWAADWRLGVGVSHQRDVLDNPLNLEDRWDSACEEVLQRSGVAPKMFRNSGLPDVPPNAGDALLAAHEGTAMMLSFGRLRLPKRADVRFEMGGGAPYWCHGIVFGGLELRAVGLSWEQKRLLLLCRDGRAGGAECWLQRLPGELIEQVVRMLHTPLHCAVD